MRHREAAEFDVVFANGVEQETVESGSDLANNLVNAVDIRETVAAPKVVLDVFRGMKARMTPAEVLARTQGLFEGTSYIQRLNTRGGVAPQASCTASNQGQRMQVAYQADYVVYKPAR
mgnify:FL=1